jgi:hypothetical protein
VYFWLASRAWLAVIAKYFFFPSSGEVLVVAIGGFFFFFFFEYGLVALAPVEARNAP